MLRIETDGNRVLATIDIANNGHVWAQEKIEAIIQDGKLQEINIPSFEFQFWRI